MENGTDMEYGPSIHGIGEQSFLYFRDPSGMRVEVNTGGYRNYVPDWEPYDWKPSQGSNNFYRNGAMPMSMTESFPPADGPSATEEGVHPDTRDDSAEPLRQAGSGLDRSPSRQAGSGGSGPQHSVHPDPPSTPSRRGACAAVQANEAGSHRTSLIRRRRSTVGIWETFRPTSGSSCRPGAHGSPRRKPDFRCTAETAG